MRNKGNLWSLTTPKQGGNKYFIVGMKSQLPVCHLNRLGGLCIGSVLNEHTKAVLLAFLHSITLLAYYNSTTAMSERLQLCLLLCLSFGWCENDRFSFVSHHISSHFKYFPSFFCLPVCLYSIIVYLTYSERVCLSVPL